MKIRWHQAYREVVKEILRIQYNSFDEWRLKYKTKLK